MTGISLAGGPNTGSYEAAPMVFRPSYLAPRPVSSPPPESLPDRLRANGLKIYTILFIKSKRKRLARDFYNICEYLIQCYKKKFNPQMTQISQIQEYICVICVSSADQISFVTVYLIPVIKEIESTDDTD